MSKKFKALLMALVLFTGLSFSPKVFADEKLNVETCALVFQTDFGVKNDAVASMKGVAFGVSPKLKMFDLTHQVTPYDIWEAGYWLNGAAAYWPENTVFVSVVDPGVGTDRKSVVLKTKTNQYFVTPDNGTLTLIAENYGIEEVREIDEAVNRLKNSEKSYTFHGRDVYAYTGARLAAGVISFKEVGKKLPNEVVKIDYQKPEIKDNKLYGIVTVIDQPYGNIWTSIPRELFEKAKINLGDKIRVTISNEGKKIYDEIIPYVETFGKVEEGKSLCYMNSELKAAFAVNMGNFSEDYKIGSGFNWVVSISKAK